MLEVMVLLLILLAGLIPGGLLLYVLRERMAAAAVDEASDWLAWGFASALIGLILIGWTAVILAEFGWFSLLAVGVIWLAAIVILFVLAFKQSHPPITQLPNPPISQSPNYPITQLPNYPITKSRWEAPLLLLWLIAAMWLFLRPHQFIMGAGDAGVYVNLGINIHKTGSILIQDEGLADLDPTLQDVVLRPIRNPVAESYLLPAFYVTDAAAGEIMPQFYPLHPVWYALAFGLAGLQAELMMTGFWAILACLAVYLFVRQISRWQVAFLALAALSLNGMQVWFARYPTSEALTQFLLWTGLWATAVWLSNRPLARVWALLAGASLGSLFLVRIDVLFVLPLLALFVVWQWRRKQPALGWFTVPLLVLVAHSLLHALSQSRPYFFDLYNYAVLSLLHGQTGLLLVSGLGVVGLALFAAFFQPITHLLNRYRRPLLALLIVGLLGLALYGWFIRPYGVGLTSYADQFSATQLTQYNHENFVRLGWYLSPVGIWLGVLGICLLLWRVSWQTAVMLLITLFFAIFFIWNIRNNPTQIYAMRRYMPAVLPLFTVGAATFIGSLFYRQPTTDHRLPLTVWRATAVILAILWLGSTIWAARGFVSQVDYVGLPQQIAEFSEMLDSRSVILWNTQEPVGLGDQVGAPLKFQYEHDIYILRNLEVLDSAVLVSSIEKWQNSGRSIYWVGDTTWLNEQQLAYTETTYEFNSQYLEHSADYKPTAVTPLRWLVELAKLEE